MSITYAGISLHLEDPDGKASEWINRYLSLDDLRMFGVEPIARYNNTLPIPYPNFSLPPPMRFNSLYWPTGASRWSFGLFLVDAVRLEKILEKVSGTAPRESRNEPQQLVLTDTGFDAEVKSDDFSIDTKNRIALSTEMFALPPRPVSPTVYEDGLWMLPLVDVRYYWQWKSTREFAASDYGECGIWDDVFVEIEDELDVAPSGLTWDEVADGYDQPDTEYLAEVLSHANAAVVLDAVAASVGQRVTRWIDGTIYSIDPVESETILTDNLTAGSAEYTNWTPVCGDDFSTKHQAAAKPEQVSVGFNDPCIKVWNEILESAGNHSVTDFVEGMTKQFRVISPDPFTAGEPNAVSAAHATQIAADFYAWLAHRYDRSFASIKAWNPTGFDDYMLWDFGRRHPDGILAGQTRVHSVPYNLGVETLLPLCGVPECGCDVIRFTIILANCPGKWAVVQIDARPCGCDEVPEETDAGSYEIVIVHDPQGCFFDEPSEDLEDREGWAKYMEGDLTGLCRWEVFSLCCDPDVCLP